MPADMFLSDDLIKAWREDGARCAVRRLLLGKMQQDCRV